ncbi:MAG: DUF1700 domain-containing protein [Lachnospiraceae bacterium]|nr:DUF1700 domain-containing protein [Lachnospiraceae bacterium]
MMKNEFLVRLKELLCDLPQEERDEAVRYYEDYFEDAGPLEEPRVLKELISPEDVAEKIRAGCTGREKTDCEIEFAGSGYKKQGEGNVLQEDVDKGVSDLVQDEIGKEENQPGEDRVEMAASQPAQDKVEMAENQPWQNDIGTMWEQFTPEEPGTQGFSWDQEDARTRDEWMRREEDYAQDYEKTDQYEHAGRRFHSGGYGEENHRHGAAARARTYFSPVIFILALVVGLPIICPILFAFICMMGCFFFFFGIGGISLVAVGVALVGNSLAHISVGSGLVCLLSGGGLVLTALGIIFIVFAVNCAFRAIPALCRGIRNIVLALRGRRV